MRISVWAAVALLVIPFTSLSEVSQIDNEYFPAFKEFLNSEFGEYEVVFSILHHSHKALEDELAGFTKGKGAGFSMILDKPVYYRVRRTRNGFSLHSAHSLDEIENEVIGGGQSAFGVLSNVYWSANSSTIYFDEWRSVDMEERLGSDWISVQCEQAVRALSFGMYVRKGSVVWDGTNFTAESAASLNPKRRISGTLTLSNGLPFLVRYLLGSLKHEVALSYEKPIATSGRLIPNRFRVIHELPKTHGSNMFTWELIGLSVTNFAPSSTSPQEFLSTASRMTVVQRSVNGTAKAVALHGVPLKHPVGVKMRTDRLGNEHSKPTKWVVVVVLFLSSLFLLRTAFRAHKERRDSFKKSVHM